MASSLPNCKRKDCLNLALVGEFPENLGDVSEEQGDQDIKIMEERYQGRWDSNMMADYCWALMRDFPEAVY